MSRNLNTMPAQQLSDEELIGLLRRRGAEYGNQESMETLIFETLARLLQKANDNDGSG